MVPGPDRDRAVLLGDEIENKFGFVPITKLTRFEVIQGLRFEAWRYRNDHTQGLPPQLVETATNLFLAQIGTLYQIVSLNFEQLLLEAERLTRTTPEKGWRTLDILQVAAATILVATDFFSFDHKENEMASLHGLKTPLKVA